MRYFVLVTVTLGLLNCASAPIFASEDAHGVESSPTPVDTFKLPITGALPGSGPAPGRQWLLPMADSLPLAGARPVQSKPVAQSKPQRLDGSINLSDSENLLSNRVGELLDVALNRDQQSSVLDKAVRHYRTKTQRVIAEGKDAADYVVPFRGFATSSEAGDVILDEKVKLKSRSSAEYARQKHVDETHLKIVSCMMQMAMGLGMKENGRGGEVLAEGLVSLEKLVGKEEAEKTLMMLTHWSKAITVSDSVYQSVAWDVKQKQEKLQCVTKEAMDADPVVHEIIKRIHKYNKKSNAMRATAKVVQTTLGVASLTPTFVGPAAKTALVAFIMATGGPESAKLLKELYLDKRLDSRWKTLNEEAHLAVDNYQLGALTRNPVLMACSEALIHQLTGAEVARSVLGESILQTEKESVASSQDNL